MSRLCLKLSGTLLLSGLSLMALAQDTTAVITSDAHQDWMTAHGKIRVVMVVCLTILMGLLAYLVRLDIKISRLEKSKR